MKIGIDARLYSQTGVGRYIRNLINELKKIDTQNEYIIFLLPEDFDKVSVNSPKWTKKILNVKWHSLMEQIRLPFLLKKEKCDLIHFPYFSVPIFYPGKYVITVHDLIMNHFNTGQASTLPLPIYRLKHAFYGLIIRQAIKKSARIITVSKATKHEIMDHYSVSDSKIDVIYEASELIDEAQNTGQKNIEDKKYFLYVGNAYPHKNLETLISAFKQINEKYDNVQLVLVGGKDYFYTRLQNKITEQKISNIIFYGSATDTELIKLFKNAIALISPSLMEGFGLPAVEAMSLGCTVIASNIPSLTEICGDGALYFNPRNPGELHKIITQLMDNKDIRKKQIQKGFEQSKKFSWKKTAKETFQTYENCIRL